MQDNQENQNDLEINKDSASTTEESIMEPVIKPPSRVPLILSILSLILAILLVLVGIWLYWQFQENQTRNILQGRQLERSLMQAQAEVSQQQQLMNLTQQKLRELIRLNTSANQVWKLDEVEYLIRLAAYHLTFENDTAIATKLLETAQQKIAELNNPKFLGIQQVLANNIMALNTLPKVDIVDLILKINALSQQVAQLPIIPSQGPQAGLKAGPAISQNLPWWQRIWLGISQSFHNMLIIRHHQTPIEPLLPPQQKEYLVENIQIQLSLAQWAVLHQKPSIYQQSLQKAIDWIQHYFVPDASGTQNLLKTLTELQNINIKPAVPDLSDILSAIRNARNAKPAAPSNSGSSAQESVAS